MNLARLRIAAEEAFREAGPLTLGRFRILRKLGQGAMGAVHEAEDERLRRPVAVKVLHESLLDNASAVARFQREAQAAARVVHPNVVQVFDSGVEEGRPYLVMELVRGRSLGDVMAGPFELRPMLELLEKVARGVGAAHEAGIIHRDIKPANILVAEGGEPKVGDFGLARCDDADTVLTRSGVPVGTPRYMSPEQVRGQASRIGPATDVYALGAILYEILTGRTPHDGGSTEEIYGRITRDDPVSPRSLNPRVANDLATIALKALEKEPERRYPGAVSFADDLRRNLRGEAILARPASVLGRAWRKASRHGAAIGSAFAVVVALASLGAWALGHRVERADAARREEARRRLETARATVGRAAFLRYDARSSPTLIIDRVREIRPLIEEAVALAPELADCRFLLGQAWDLEGWTDRAEAEWREAIRLDPALGAAHFQLGRLLLCRAFFERNVNPELSEPGLKERIALEAAGEINAALAIHQGFDEKLQREVAAAMLALIRGDLAEVRSICARGAAAAGRNQGAEDFHWLLGVASPGPDRLPAYANALAIRPKHDWVLYCRACALLDEGGKAEGRAALDEAIAVNPRFAAAYLSRGNLRDAEGDFGGAVGDFTEALRVEPRNLAGLLNRANSRSRAGDMKGSVEDYTSALGIRPRWTKAVFWRGLARAQGGDWAGAIRDYEEAAALDPRWAEIHSSLALAHERCGDSGALMADLRNYLALIATGDPNRPRAEAWLKHLESAVPPSRN